MLAEVLADFVEGKGEQLKEEIREEVYEVTEHEKAEETCE